MRALIALIVALSTWTDARAEDVPYSGVWTYQHDFMRLSIHLRPQGDCTVLALPPNTNTIHVVPCGYSLEDPYLTIHWKQPVDGRLPEPTTLVFVADGYFLRVLGEPARMLRWSGPSRLQVR